MLYIAIRSNMGNVKIKGTKTQKKYPERELQQQQYARLLYIHVISYDTYIIQQ